MRGIQGWTTRAAVLRAALVTGAVAAAVLSGAGPATAGTYAVQMCGDAADRAPGPWLQASRDASGADVTVTARQTCATGGAVEATGVDGGAGEPRLLAGGYTQLTVSTPVGVSITASNVKAALFGQVNLGGRDSADLHVRTVIGLTQVSDDAIGHNGGYNRRDNDPINLPGAVGPAFSLRVTCEPPEGTQQCALYNRDSAILGIFGATFQASDPTGPVIRNPTGTATAGDLQGGEELRVDAADAGSGVKRVALSLDGTELAATDFSRECNTASFVVCPQQRQGVSLPFDTSRVANGDHDLKVTATDWSGSSTTTTIRRVTVSNPSAPGVPADVPAADGIGRGASAGAQCFYRASDDRFFNPAAFQPRQPNGTSAGAALTAELTRTTGSGKRRKTVGTPKATASFSSSPVVRGTLRDAAGNAVGGARIFLATRTEGGTWSLCGAPQAVTGAQGEWSAKLPAGQPNREVLATYWAASDDNASIGSGVLALSVRAGVTVAKVPSRVRNGRSVRFRGTVAGPIPRGGALALLQVQVAGSKRFRTFRQVRTNGSGALSARYRFRASSGQRYRFRVYVPRQEGRPFVAGSSAVRSVRVR